MFLPIHPKPAWTSPLLARLGIGGFYFPLTAEPHVDVELPDSEIPFCASHEVAHELGFAREDEANYVGYLLCRLHPDADFKYSGAYMASRHALAALASVDRPEARALGGASLTTVLHQPSPVGLRQKHRQTLTHIGHFPMNAPRASLRSDTVRHQSECCPI